MTQAARLAGRLSGALNQFTKKGTPFVMALDASCLCARAQIGNVSMSRGSPSCALRLLVCECTGRALMYFSKLFHRPAVLDSRVQANLMAAIQNCAVICDVQCAWCAD